MTDGLLTSVVGSHAHPGWFVSGVAAAERGEFGPADLAEMLDDAVDLAIRDQESAGIDVITDGEMRRAGFFTAEFYRHLPGLRALPPDRRLGPAGHDQQHRFEVMAPLSAPNGLGVVEEFTAARPRTTRPLKVTLPGPYTLSGRLVTGPGGIYETRVAAGVVDVKSYDLETAEVVAARIDAILATGVSPERLALVPDCGFSQTARWAAIPKLRALVAGRDLVLGRLPAARSIRPPATASPVT